VTTLRRRLDDMTAAEVETFLARSGSDAAIPTGSTLAATREGRSARAGGVLDGLDEGGQLGERHAPAGLVVGGGEAGR
jgi:hypothetical protein